MCSIVTLAAGDSLGLHLDVIVGNHSERSALQHVFDLVLQPDRVSLVVVQLPHLVDEISPVVVCSLI